MPSEFEICPTIGIGPVRLGMSRAEVHGLLGTPLCVDLDGYREEMLEGFFVQYNAEECVEALMLASSSELLGLFEGQYLLKLTYPDALAHLRQFGDFDGDDFTSTSLELQMSLWRGIPQGRFESITLGGPGYFT